MNRHILLIAVLSLQGLFEANLAKADDQLSIPCKNDAGKVFNAKPEDVCVSILPKCSDLRKTMIESMKDMISVKIYGYYHLNKDIELNQESISDPAKLKGKELPYPVCSVVGHKVSADEKGEIESQSTGKGLPCGEFPKIVHGDKWTYTSEVVYEGTRGQRWFSWVQGALPWELRRSAYDINKELEPELGNLGKVLSSSAMSDSVRDGIIKIRNEILKLSGKAKLACHSPSSDIVNDCKSGKLSLTDPVNRVCTLAKAQLALNEVAVPNMLVFEAMERTKTLHDRHFKNIFIGTQGEFGKLVGHCADNKSMVGILAGLLDFWPFEDIFQWLKANKSYSCFTSCMLDGQSYYTAIDDGQHESCPSQICGGKKRRQCSKMSRFSITSGKPYNALLQAVIESESQSKEDGTDWWGAVIMKLYISDAGGINKVINESNPTNNTGFAAMVEKIIRKDICGQTKSRTEDNPCDQIDIPDQPKKFGGG